MSVSNLPLRVASVRARLFAFARNPPRVRPGEIRRMNRRFAVLAVALVCAARFASAEDSSAADSARAVLAAQSKNVVTVRLAARVRVGSADSGTMDMDLVIEATGFLLDPAGLVVTSLNATDPRQLYEKSLNDESSGGAADYTLTSEVSRTTVVFEDGTEIEAEAGLRDTDLDLAFFLLKKPAPAGTVVAPASAAPKAFDALVVLRRLGEVAGRSCAGALVPVQAAVERPRKFYLVSNDVAVGLGEPAFDLAGHFVGIVTLRNIKAGSTRTEYLFSGEDPYSAVIILPLADVLEGARQHEKFKGLAK